MRRRRNKLVLWESPRERADDSKWRARRRAETGRDALLAIALLGTIFLALSVLPIYETGEYRRDRVANSICLAIGTEPETSACVATSIGVWLLTIVTLGVILKAGPACVRGLGGGE